MQVSKVVFDADYPHGRYATALKKLHISKWVFHKFMTMLISPHHHPKLHPLISILYMNQYLLLHNFGKMPAHL